MLLLQKHHIILREILSHISTDYFQDVTNQMNVITMVKQLLVKNYIDDNFWQTQFEQCLNELNAQHRSLSSNVDFDEDFSVLNPFMKLCVFVRHQLIPKESAVLLCNESNTLVMTYQSDLMKNRTFLGMKICFGKNDASETRPYESNGLFS